MFNSCPICIRDPAEKSCILKYVLKCICIATLQKAVIPTLTTLTTISEYSTSFYTLIVYSGFILRDDIATTNGLNICVTLPCPWQIKHLVTQYSWNSVVWTLIKLSQESLLENILGLNCLLVTEIDSVRPEIKYWWIPREQNNKLVKCLPVNTLWRHHSLRDLRLNSNSTTIPEPMEAMICVLSKALYIKDLAFESNRRSDC